MRQQNIKIYVIVGVYIYTTKIVHRYYNAVIKWKLRGGKNIDEK